MENTMNWLLEDSSPEIKYRTMIELQGRKKDEPEVQETYQKLLNSELICRTMEKFQDKNKWEHINAFLILAECGLTREDVDIDEAVEFLMKKINKGMKCAKTLMLRNFVALGYQEHPWVKEQVQLAFSTVREDGTVHCLDAGKKRNDSRLDDMGCHRQTTTYLLLAAELKKRDIRLPQFDALIDFYRRHHVMYHMDETGKIVTDKDIITEMTNTFFPIDHVHIGIQTILYGLSVLGVGNDKACQETWDKLYSYRQDDGKYLLGDSFKEPYFSVGMPEQPNKWVTLYALLSEKYSNK